MNFELIPLVLLFLTSCAESGEDLVDPMDMKPARKVEYEEDREHCGRKVVSYQALLNECRKEQGDVDLSSRACLSFMTRFVNVVLKGTGLQNHRLSYGNTKTVTLEVRVSGKDLETLQDFGNGKDVTLFEIDSVLTQMFLPKNGATQAFLDSVMASFQKGYGSYFTPEFLIISFVGVLVLIFIWLFLMGRSFGMALRILLMLVFMTGVTCNWLKYYNEEVIKQKVTLEKFRDIPIDCRPWDMSWYQKLGRIFESTDRCEEYHRAAGIEPHINVPWDKVFSETFSVFLFTPFSKVGPALNDFNTALTSNLPFPLNYFCRIVLMLFIPLLSLVALAFLLGIHVKLGSFFAHMEFSTRPYISMSSQATPEPTPQQIETSRSRVSRFFPIKKTKNKGKDKGFIMKKRPVKCKFIVVNPSTSSQKEG